MGPLFSEDGPRWEGAGMAGPLTDSYISTSLSEEISPYARELSSASCARSVLSWLAV